MICRLAIGLKLSARWLFEQFVQLCIVSDIAVLSLLEMHVLQNIWLHSLHSLGSCTTHLHLPHSNSCTTFLSSSALTLIKLNEILMASSLTFCCSSYSYSTWDYTCKELSLWRILETLSCRRSRARTRLNLSWLRVHFIDGLDEKWVLIFNRLCKG